MPSLHLQILGGFGFESGGEPLPAIRSTKARSLLAYLAAEADRPHRRESLCGLFWPDSTERLARQSLSQALHSLKAVLPDGLHDELLEITPQEIIFNRKLCEVDLQEFDRLLQGSQRHAHTSQWACRQCMEHLERAACLYRGDFLEGYSLAGCVAFEEWLLVRRQACLQSIIQVCQQLSQGLLLLNEPEEALSYARRWLAYDPLDEAGHRQVMSLLNQMDRRGEALAQYAVCEQLLADELGISPAQETTSLYQCILADLSERVASPPRPHNLPALTASLVGRQGELEELCHLLADTGSRLVTVVGGGGCGKTRLALEAGRSLLPLFPDGVFWVELDTFQTGLSLAPLVCAALELESGPASASFRGGGSDELKSALFAYLRQKKLLLILDGFEGMLPEANLVASLLRRASQLKILITSRTLLNLQLEHVFPLEGLCYPSPDEDNPDFSRFSALQLFEQAARRRTGSVDFSPTSQAAVVEICRHLEGLPLGILLAASWTNALTPEQILNEIRRSLDFLSTHWRDLPERQRSLIATFDYSYFLQPEPERTAFLRLGVFHSPFTHTRACQVAGTSLTSLQILIEQSLVQRVDESRFRMHNLLRQYALEKLAEDARLDEEIHQQHCQVYLEALAAWEPRLKGPEQFDVLDEMTRENADLLAAWDWGVEHDQLVLLENAVEAFRYYHHLRHFIPDTITLCQKAVRRLESNGVAGQNLRLWLRLKLWLLENLTDPQRFDQGLPILQQIETQLEAMSSLQIDLQRELNRLYLSKASILCLSNGERQRIMELLDRTQKQVSTEQDSWERYMILQEVGLVYADIGNIRDQQRMVEAVLAIQQSVGDPIMTTATMVQRSFGLIFFDDPQNGLRILQEQLEIRQQLRSNNLFRQAHSLALMGRALFFSGQYQPSRIQLQEALRLHLPHNRQRSCSVFRFDLALIDLMTGNYEAVLQDRAYAGMERSQLDRQLACLPRGCAYLVLGQWSQAEEELIRSRQYYLTSTRWQWLGIPLALLGYLAYRNGEPENARQLLLQALENGLQQGFHWVLCLSLAVLAVISCEKGDLEAGATWYAIANNHPSFKNTRFMQDAFRLYIDPQVAQLPPETLQAAQERGLHMSREDAAQEWLVRLGAGWLPGLPNDPA